MNSGESNMVRLTAIISFLLLLSLTARLCIAQQAVPKLSALPPETADQIVEKLIQRNGERARRLQHYTGMRSYHLLYRGYLGKHEASMTVECTFDAPATKQFKIISESGSKLIRDRIFRKLLESEQEALTPQNRSRTALAPENYDFKMVGIDTSSQSDDYVLEVHPKNDNKFLYRGKVWIDGKDFAVARIAAHPAKNPSFWIKKTDIAQTYEKLGEFWLPAENKTVSYIRFGGTATLTIEYSDYKWRESSANSAFQRQTPDGPNGTDR